MDLIVNNIINGISASLMTNWSINNVPRFDSKLSYIFWGQLIILYLFPCWIVYESILWTFTFYFYYREKKRDLIVHLKKSNTKFIPRLVSSRILLIILWYWWSHIFEDHIIADLTATDIAQTPIELLIFIYYTYDLFQVAKKRHIIQRIHYITNRVFFMIGLSIIPFILGMYSDFLFYFYFIGILTIGSEENTPIYGKNLPGFTKTDPDINVELYLESLISNSINHIWLYVHKKIII